MVLNFASFAQFSKFQKLKFEMKFQFEIEYRKGELTPPIFRLTTCSFYCEITGFDFPISREKGFPRNAKPNPVISQ